MKFIYTSLSICANGLNHGGRVLAGTFDEMGPTEPTSLFFELLLIENLSFLLGLLRLLYTPYQACLTTIALHRRYI